MVHNRLWFWDCYVLCLLYDIGISIVSGKNQSGQGGVPIELKWHGPVWGQSGYEQLTRNLIIALDKLGVGVELHPATEWNSETVLIEAEDRDRLTRMVHQQVSRDAVQVCHQRPQDPYPNAKKKICYSLFETNRCPDAWIEDLDTMDKIWVFSEFNRKYWSACWIQKQKDASKIDVIPFGIDTDLFSPGVKAPWITNKKGFTFLTIGDFTERKNFEGLLEAFVTEFTAEDDVCLIMKVHYQGFVRRYQDAIFDKIKGIINRFSPKNPPRILFFGNKISSLDMPALYAIGDCFVLPTRGEGLGIPIIEAMACGKPVIATGWGAQADYMTEENSLSVKYDIRVIDDIDYIKKCLVAVNHSWAFPDTEDLREKMRWIYENQDEAKKMGAAGRKDMEGRTWQKTGLAMVKKILEVS